ncbi:MAG: TlpA family protein disulfide reductase [Verrucomicrobiota bacterium]
MISRLACGAEEVAPSPRIVLQDQFDKTRQLTFPASKPVFVAIADQDAAKPMKLWIEASKQQFGTNVTYIGVADVRKVPAFLRSFIRKKFKEAYSYPVLLDWSGTLTQAFNAKSGVPNIYLLSRDGKNLANEVGAVTQEKLQRIGSALNELGKTGP